MENKMNRLVLVLSTIVGCLIPGYVLAEWPHNHYSGAKAKSTYEYNRKGTQYNAGYGNIIIGFPVTDLGLKYYYAVKDPEYAGTENSGLSDEEIERITDKISEKTAERVVSKLIDKFKTEGSDKPATPPPTPDNKRQEVENKVAAIFKSRCFDCHVAKTSGGFALLVDDKLNGFSGEQKWQIFDAVDTQRMPLRGDPLSIDEIGTIREWARLKQVSGVN
jgi:mono/diheme cytochrome c family protein